MDDDLDSIGMIGKFIRIEARFKEDQFRNSAAFIDRLKPFAVEFPGQSDRANLDAFRYVVRRINECDSDCLWIDKPSPRLELTVVAPSEFQPPAELVQRAGSTRCTVDLSSVDGAEVLDTDVWVSMGKENEGNARIEALRNYRIDDELVRRASPKVAVMHCLPADRGKEITDEVFERFAKTIFD